MMVEVAASGVPTAYPVPGITDMVRDSGGSEIVSSRGLMTTDAETAPLGMVTEPVGVG